ncbi:NAD-dependent epimerase/dehydratase family protein [Leptotrichia massiliensis]|uniref:NAD-dependent epimerase/dehydratase family protein n=1 Tax=Leptotrichia massiliensis TaxID=1852388 RepID=UPI0008D9A0EA|nr:NAD-dependent epimerase/dehydratase family protein [Leptotrichia massiliensis]
MKEKKILITGASGFIGKYVLKKIKDNDLDFLAIDAQKVLDVSSENQRVISLLDKENLGEVIKSYKPNVIVHLAAIALVTHKNTGEIYNVNVQGTENLLESAQNYCDKNTRVILASTAGVYGNQNVDKYGENLTYNPANHYSYSKMITEYISKQYKEDLDIVTIRPFNIIGVGQSEKFLVPKLVEHFADRKEKLSVGNISSFRDYVDVEYCAEVIMELISRKKLDFDILNICSGIPTNGEMIIQLLQEITDFKPEIEISSDFVRKNEVWRMIGDTTRLWEFMNGKKSQSVKDILVKMLDYYKNR